MTKHRSNYNRKCALVASNSSTFLPTNTPPVRLSATDAFKKISIDFLEKTRIKLMLFLEKPKKFLKKLQHNIKRSKRSERIEAIKKICDVLIPYVELWTLAVGTHNKKGDFVSLCDFKYISEKAEISFWRVKRAISDLVKAGYLKITPQNIKKPDGNIRGIAGIKEFSTSFFVDLGLDYIKLKQARNWKIKRIETKAAKNQKKKGGSFLHNLLSPFRKKKKDIIQNKAAPTNNHSFEKNKRLVNESLRLHKLNPERTIRDIYIELEKMIL